MRLALLLAIFCLEVSASQFDKELKRSWMCVLEGARPVARRVQDLGYTDKAMHCIMSCELTRRCDRFHTLGLGIIKELIDLLGYGNPELADLKANIIGIRLAYSGSARSFDECREQCLIHYPQERP